jgi:hypothetical protein
MRLKRALTSSAMIACVAVSLAMPTSTLGAPPEGTELDLALCAPREHTFSLNIDNTFNPLPVGQRWVYRGKEQGLTIGLRITVLDETESFYSGSRTVTTRVVEELEWNDANENGLVDDGPESLLEISRNFYAQTEDGTVCYFGEEVDIYEGGVVVSHEGAWRADDRGNAPGIFMPADPLPGMTYQQEVAPDIAEDQATVIRRGRTVTVPAGTFADTLTIRDFNPLDGSKGTKVYAPDVGLIIDGPLSLIDY